MGGKFIAGLWGVLATLVVMAAGCAKSPAGPTAASATPAVATVASTAAALTRIDLGEGLYVRQLRPDVFEVTHAFPWPAN